MLSLLAQSIPDPMQLAGFLGCVAFLVGISVGIKKLLAKDTGPAPQPFVVTEHPAFVTLQSHDRDIREIKDELKRHAGRRAEIYDTQKEQGAQISALVEKTDHINATQIRQESKIDIILQRLPRP